MRKSVAILIGIIYIVSIVIVGFFGLKIKGYDTTTYVSEVAFVGDDIRVVDDGTKQIVIEYSEGLTYQLQWKVSPDDATHPEVRFGYDETTNVGEVNQDGLITFYRQGVISVFIHSTDGSSKNDYVKVIAFKSKGGN